MSYVWVFLLLNFSVMIHELGHFLGARLVGIPVTKFSIGFGPALVRREFFGTEFRIAPIFLGGYVSLDDERMKSTAWWRRAAMIVGGPLINLVVPMAVMAAFYAFSGRDPMDGIAWVGGVVGEAGRVLLTDLHASDFSGPVGIVHDGAQFMMDWGKIVKFFALLNIILGVSNLLPIPVLDGGRLWMLLFEGLPGWNKVRIALESVCAVVMICFMAYITFADIKKLF